MTRGFTLLELLITVSVLSILLAFTVPSFSTLKSTTQVQHLASELLGFVILGKSEAILRRQPLWGHYIASGGANSDGSWMIQLTDHVTQGEGVVIYELSGKPFNGVTISTSYTSQQISFDATHGRPKNGRFTFYPNPEPSNQLELITYHRSAIVRVCSTNNALLYGYERC